MSTQQDTELQNFVRSDYYAEISGAIFEQQAAVMARLQLTVVANGPVGQNIKFGTYEAQGHHSKVFRLVDYVPDGSIVVFGTDVMWGGEAWLNSRFRVNKASRATAQLKVVGALGNINIFLKEIHE